MIFMLTVDCISDTFGEGTQPCFLLSMAVMLRCKAWLPTESGLKLITYNEDFLTNINTTAETEL